MHAGSNCGIPAFGGGLQGFAPGKVGSTAARSGIDLESLWEPLVQALRMATCVA